jgi:hypothetical protein
MNLIDKIARTKKIQLTQLYWFQKFILFSELPEKFIVYKLFRNVIPLLLSFSMIVYAEWKQFYALINIALIRLRNNKPEHSSFSSCLEEKENSIIQFDLNSNEINY